MIAKSVWAVCLFIDKRDKCDSAGGRYLILSMFFNIKTVNSHFNISDKVWTAQLFFTKNSVRLDNDDPKKYLSSAVIYG